MKYGQQFASELSGTSAEYQQASIDYKKLKKSIKRIQNELQTLGLDAELLKELLSAGNPAAPSGTDEDSEEHDVLERKSSVTGVSAEETGEGFSTLRQSPSSKSIATLKKLVRQGGHPSGDNKQKKGASRPKRKQSRARAEYELAGTVDNPTPRIKLVFSSASSESGSDSSAEEHAHVRSSRHEELYERIRQQADSSRFVELNESESNSGAANGEEESDLHDSDVEDASADDGLILPTPRASPRSRLSPLAQDAEPPTEYREKLALLGKMYGKGLASTTEVMAPGKTEDILPSSPTGQTNGTSHLLSAQGGSLATLENGDSTDDEDAVVQGPQVLLAALHLGSDRSRAIEDESDSSIAAADDADGEEEAGEGGSRPDVQRSKDLLSPTRSPTLRAKRHKRRPRRPRREVTINLEYDSEFFVLLNQALSSLNALLDTEKASFSAAVQSLAGTVSANTSSAKNQKDLYAWREVFSLWVEAQIFESERERDRGERPIAEVERRLDWFVDQVGRRKLAKKMKSKDSRKALERFVELNQELLQLKRVGLANREAARKILKKHDKRLGLSASTDFPDFVAAQQRTPGTNGHDSGALVARSALAKTAQSDEMTSLIFVGLTTLPHVLLAVFTNTLLPIIPQIEDYACLICGDIAWRPIALNCGHRFCVRCLVKMQKRDQDACPACRAPVVLQANKENLDAAMMTYQKRWFPREVKQKEKESKREIEKEIAEELELAGKCIVS